MNYIFTTINYFFSICKLVANNDKVCCKDEHDNLDIKKITKSKQDGYIIYTFDYFWNLWTNMAVNIEGLYQQFVVGYKNSTE